MSLSISFDGSQPTRVALAGELDIYTIPVFMEHFPRIESARPFVLDLTAVDLIDSAGLAGLVRLARTLPPEIGRLSILGTPLLRRLLAVTGLSDQFAVEIIDERTRREATGGDAYTRETR